MGFIPLKKKSWTYIATLEKNSPQQEDHDFNHQKKDFDPLSDFVVLELPSWLVLSQSITDANQSYQNRADTVTMDEKKRAKVWSVFIAKMKECMKGEN